MLNKFGYPLLIKYFSLAPCCQFSKTQGGKNLMNNQVYTMCDQKVLKKVQVGKDQEKAQSEKDSHAKNRGGKKLN